MKQLCLLILIATFASAAEPIVVGEHRFPSVVAGIPWLQATNYEAATSPGGGIGVSYRSEELKIDIYFFDAGDPAWLKKSLDERFALEGRSFTATLKEMEQRGIYSGVEFKVATDLKVGTLLFAHLAGSYPEKELKKKSHFYLAVFRDRLLKIRITALGTVSDTAIAAAFDEAAVSFTQLR